MGYSWRNLWYAWAIFFLKKCIIDYDMFILSIFSFVFILFVIADDDKLNPWMLAMIGIGGVFIAFVGVSIYLMWYVLHVAVNFTLVHKISHA